MLIAFRALAVWGSQQALDHERKKKAEEMKRYQQCMFTNCNDIFGFKTFFLRYFQCEACPA